MDTRLTQTLSIVRQLAQTRQRDAADIIATILGMSELEFPQRHEALKNLFEPPNPGEDVDWGAPPGMMSLRYKSRDPIEPGVALTDELANALERLNTATPDRQDATRLILGNMIENEAQELDLTPEEAAELKRTIDASIAEMDAGLGIEWKPGEPLPGLPGYRSSGKNRTPKR
jgi:hypothetical protein